jgi:beta-phosphoglucomutase-like phosphatase (HAD superfamily)
MSENFTVLVQLTALFLGARLAIFGVTTALTLLQAHPVIATITLLTAGLILLNDAAKNVQFGIDESGASVTSFNTAISESAKNGKYVTDRYGEFKVAITEASDEAVRLGKEVALADQKKLERLKAQIVGVGVSARYSANEVRRMREAAGLPGVVPAIETGGTGGGGAGTTGGSSASPSTVISGLPQLIADSKKNATVLKRQVRLEGKGLSAEVAKWVTSSNTPVKAANQALKRIAKNGEKAINNLTRNYQNSTAGQQAAAAAQAAAASQAAAAAEEARRQAEELRRAEEARIEGLNQLYANFLDTIKGTFAGIRNAIQGAFDITGLGGSTNAIIRNMNKLLSKMKSFSTNVKSLATMGLDPALLQQIIQSGPVAGSRIAAALVSGGAGALASINAGFGQVGSLASEIAETGVRSLFDTQAQQNQYNITVTGGVGSGATIGKAIVDAIKDYERTSGAVWQGA